MLLNSDIVCLIAQKCQKIIRNKTRRDNPFYDILSFLLTNYQYASLIPHIIHRLCFIFNYPYIATMKELSRFTYFTKKDFFNYSLQNDDLRIYLAYREPNKFNYKFHKYWKKTYHLHCLNISSFLTAEILDTFPQLAEDLVKVAIKTDDCQIFNLVIDQINKRPDNNLSHDATFAHKCKSIDMFTCLVKWKQVTDYNLNAIFGYAIDKKYDDLFIHIINEYNIENLTINTFILENITEYLCKQRTKPEHFNNIFTKVSESDIIISDNILCKLHLNGYVSVVDRIMENECNLEQPSIFKLIYDCNIPEIKKYLFWNERGLEDLITKCIESNYICMLKILQKQLITDKQSCKISKDDMVAINDAKTLKYLIRLGAPFYTEVANKYPYLVKEYKFITERDLETNKLPSLEVTQILIDKLWTKDSIYLHAVLENRDDVLTFLSEQKYKPSNDVCQNILRQLGISVSSDYKLLLSSDNLKNTQLSPSYFLYHSMKALGVDVSPQDFIISNNIHDIHKHNDEWKKVYKLTMENK
jgi:hypothetical protein